MNHDKLNNPDWWTTEHSSGWDRVKAAFRRDWEQTRHDLGSDSARDLQQSASDTVKQAVGKQPVARFEDLEPAFRYGHGAQSQYSGSVWNSDLEQRMRNEYPGDYDSDREYVRRGYEYRGMP